jgi:agmatine deiminase
LPSAAAASIASRSSNRCREARAARRAPAALAERAECGRRRLPDAGEFEPHDALWLAWPGGTSRQWAEPAALIAEIAALARTIRRFEPVTLAVDPAYLGECRMLLGPEFGYRAMPVNDIWIRDTGPSFLVDAGGALGASLWNFNTWGDKFDGYDADAQLAGGLADSLSSRRFVAGLITEGGALHVDGEGTVVATSMAS